MGSEDSSKHRSRSKLHKKPKGSAAEDDATKSSNGASRKAAKDSNSHFDRAEHIEEEDSGDLSDSEDEDEDEDGELVTAAIDHGIDEVLTALRSNSDRLKDKSVKFFPEVGAEGTAEASGSARREKPVYLKDYQREQILDKMDADGQKKRDSDHPETYADEQARVRSELISEINDGDAGGESEDEDFLQKRTEERIIPEVKLPDPEKDESGFLDAFLANKAWLPKKKEKHPSYNKVVDSDEDSDEFDELSEKFENAYNFRYEDPNAAEIVSYARDQSTLRRGKKSSRQKKRDKERADREKQEEEEKLELAKLRKSKVNAVTNKLAQLQEALGQGDENMAEILAKADLDADFDNDEWDKRMEKLFDDDYYGKTATAADLADAGNFEDLGESVADVTEPVAAPRPIEELSHMSKKELKRKAEKFVDENQDLLREETIKPTAGFRYREVDAENFGLTSRDILLASDKELNQFVGIKKLASYRDSSKVEQDRKRYGKSKRVRQWRKDVFGTEEAPDDSQWEKAKQEEAAKAQAELPKPKHKSKKRKHN